MSKENIRYYCIACITLDLVVNRPQVYLEEFKYRIKKTQIDSESDSDLDDKELMAKLKDSDYDYDSDSEVESKYMLKKLHSE